jgi:two-component system OmpR family sensor kinase
MNRISSLTSRLVVTAVALVAVVSLLIGTATTLAMRNSLTGQLDQDVTGELNRATHPEGPRGPSGPPPRERGGEGFGPIHAQDVGSLLAVLDDDPRGEVVTESAERALSSRALDVLADLPTDGRPRTVDLPGVGSYRAAAQETNGTTVVTGRPTEDVDDAVGSLIWWELLLTLLGIAAAAVAGAFVVRRQLRPLRDVAATAHEVSELPLASGDIDLDVRVPETLTDERTEVGQVGAALNTLLAHVETSLGARHRSEQQVRRFVADASHELRTPLATITGYAELARKRPDDGPALRAAMAKVDAESTRMSALVEDLLLLARLDAGRPLAAEPVDVTMLVLEAVDDARVVAPDHLWRLELPEESAIEVTGDELRLHQVVTNLLGNARRHTPPGTTVTVKATLRNPVVLAVHDDGPGFPPDLAASAFERFTRGDTARTREESGAGLGLSLVQAIVDAHRGRVSLDSRPGSTTFTVELPVTAD